MALKKVGRPTRKKKKKEKARRKKNRNLAPFHYALCVTLTLSHALLYTLTYIRSTTHIYIYIPYVIYIYKHGDYSKHGRQKVASGGRVGEREEKRRKKLRTRVAGGGGSPRNHSFQSYHSSRPQTGSTYHAVTSSLYHRRRVYDDQTIGFR